MKKNISIFLILFLLTSCETPYNKLPTSIDVDIPSTYNMDNSFKKVFIIAGQSNATGVSNKNFLKDKVSEEKYQEYTDGYSNVLMSTYVDWGNNLCNDFVPVTYGYGATTDYFGPELGFAEFYSKTYSDDIYIIKCSFSGSCLDNQWFDTNYNRGDLYNQLVNNVTTQINKLDNAKIVGMMWMQGESDGALNLEDKYYQNTVNLVNYLRSDLSDYISPNGMAFVDAVISNLWKNYKDINRAKIKYAQEDNYNGYIATSENGLTTLHEPASGPDKAHYDSTSEIKLGQLFFEKLEFLFK